MRRHLQQILLSILVSILLAGSAGAELKVAEQTITHGGELSASARAVLVCIPQGEEWLQWALAARQSYSFPTEVELVTAIQMGLHSDALVLLPGLGLRVHPARLMGLGLNDLRTLMAANDGANNDPLLRARARMVLQQNRWSTQSDLTVVPSFLASLGVQHLPALQALALRDQVAIGNLLESVSSVDANLQNEAAAYAGQVATNPTEFCDYFLFYLTLATKVGGDTAEARGRQAETVRSAAGVAMLGALDGPNLTGTPDLRSVESVLREWIVAGRVLGFERLSSGLYQLARSMAPGDTLDVISIQTRLASLAAKVQNLSTAAKPVAMSPSQFGEEYEFRFETGANSLNVQVNAQGRVSVAAIN